MYICNPFSHCNYTYDGSVTILTSQHTFLHYITGLWYCRTVSVPRCCAAERFLRSHTHLGAPVKNKRLSSFFFFFFLSFPVFFFVLFFYILLLMLILWFWYIILCFTQHHMRQDANTWRKWPSRLPLQLLVLITVLLSWVGRTGAGARNKTFFKK